MATDHVHYSAAHQHNDCYGYDAMENDENSWTQSKCNVRCRTLLDATRMDVVIVMMRIIMACSELHWLE